MLKIYHQDKKKDKRVSSLLFKLRNKHILYTFLTAFLENCCLFGTSFSGIIQILAHQSIFPLY